MQSLSIRPVMLDDAQAILDIYNPYIRDTSITFELEPVDLAAMQARISRLLQNGYPYLVAEIAQEVVGYCYVQPWRERAAYYRSVEISTYISPAHHNQHIGSKLVETILPLLIEKRFHLVIAGVTIPNPASIALWQKFNFQRVGSFTEVGYKFDRWLDVEYWELKLPEPAENQAA